MDNFDIPIFKKTNQIYETFYSYRLTISRQDRYTLWQKCENLILEVIEGILLASQLSKQEKLPTLERTSLKLNLLRVFLRMMKNIKVIDMKKYIILEEMIDEVGRMLGGWIKSTKEL